MTKINSRSKIREVSRASRHYSALIKTNPNNESYINLKNKLDKLLVSLLTLEY